MEASSSAPAAGSGRGQEASSSGRGSGVDLSGITRRAWKGSDVVQQDIDWLYRSRRIPAQVSCRIPRDEVEPDPEPGEFVVFVSHFERGFDLPASDFFREFLDFYKLQPHHLPGNAIFYLSCYVSFMEAYIGLLPTKEAFARFFNLRINSVQGRDIPKPKPPVRCGSCIVGSRQGSPFFKFSGLDSCSTWQETFFYARDRFPRIDAEARAPCERRYLDEVDPDPYVVWTKNKMGRTHTPRPDAPSASANPQVVERAVPIQAEVGHEFLEKLTLQGRKKKAPTPEAGSSEAPPAKRSRQEVIGGRKVSTKHYRKREMPVATGPTLKISKSASGMRPESSEDATRTSTPPQPSPKNKKKKTDASSPSKAVPDSSEPASSAPAKDAPEAPAPTKTTPTPPPATSAGTPAASTPTPPESGKLTAQQLATVVNAATTPSSGSQKLVMHAGHAAVVASETASAQVGRITEFQRQGADLGHLLDYAEKWNRADLTPATRGLGKDKLSVVDPSGPRSTGQHFGWLRRAAKEFDNAWHDASSNVTSTLDTRKQLFEELMWEHRELSEAHGKCQASIEALKAQLTALQAEKEQLVTAHREMKEQAMQASLRHARELEEVKAEAEAKLDEALKEYMNSTAVLRTELEEETVARKAAQDRLALLKDEQREYDRLVVQTDALALRLFPDSQGHAHKKVAERRTAQKMTNPDAPWDPYDHLVALSARVQHMRSVDRHLADLPEVDIQICKVLWPEEPVPANVTLTADRLKDAGWRIREWKCSTAHAGADAALRIACSWYDDLDLDAFHALRGDSPADKDPARVAKRQDRAYRIAEFAHVRTFIPPPPDVKDALSNDEEDEDAEEDAVDPEEGDAPPEAPEAGAQPPIA
ncbi:hypothetical protein QYE76_018200 [Lolium multiflorum]|uniref:Transposase (putative) gypsy type domain-containing protein n=1 Tax=Lolium multiflorum TaxID=4521 RepID=A0AAD8QEI0_LOLMU|nr:hypothetical protein QYE76_018200 [Lolium multiflorum]